KRYADEVIICYDADEAGQKATARAISILRNAGLVIRVLTVPSGKDPDEFIRSNGSEGAAAFKALIDKSGNDVEYRLAKLKAKNNTETSEGKVAYLEAAVKVIATINSPIERDVYVSKISSELGVDKNAIKQQLSRISRRSLREADKKVIQQIQSDLSGRNDKINTEHYKKPRSSSAEEALVVYLINNPDAVGEISTSVKPEQFQNTLIRRYFEYVLNRIENGLEPLTNISADFTTDEVSKLYQLMSQSIRAASTPEAMREYINVINEESSKLSKDDVISLSDSELQAYLDKIRKNKQ
ncbi:MAG: toprim domain-containing protein, partial [Ruminococcus sp.]|nr:toprim domain-containing protein [Ruminococcus sp.]